jgi:sigma-B regulation protein RsbQ
LDAHFRVLSYNLAGCGDEGERSYDPDVHSTLFGYADDLLALIAEQQLHAVRYVGHSVSGMLGMIAASARPEVFERLVLLQSSPRYLNDAATNYVGGFEQDDLNDLYTAMATNYQSWAAGFVPMIMGVDDTHVLARFSETLFKIRPDIARHVLRTIFQSDHRTIVPRVAVPTHFLHSRKDVAVPGAVAQFLHAHLPGSVLEILELEGHMPHLTQPDQVAAALLRHLSR